MTNDLLIIRLMRPDDIEQVHDIEVACFAMPWSIDSFERELTENANMARYLVAELNGRILAFAGMWLVLDEAHITNIAVRSNARRNGIGRLITTALVQLAADSGMAFITLEVRRSNLAAQALYRSLGFIDVGYRKRYYADSNEDALIMTMTELPEGNPENDPFIIIEDDPEEE